MEKVIVIGKQSRKVKGVEKILSEYFHHIYLIQDISTVDNLLTVDGINAIVVIDFREYELNKNFFSVLKIFFPSAKLLCLADQVSPPLEIAMRSYGPVFLGSYAHFVKNYREILDRLKASSFYNLPV